MVSFGFFGLWIEAATLSGFLPGEQVQNVLRRDSRGRRILSSDEKVVGVQNH
jgi:hypothetical protein